LRNAPGILQVNGDIISSDRPETLRFKAFEGAQVLFDDVKRLEFLAAITGETSSRLL